jgi:hypothetical protein
MAWVFSLSAECGEQKQAAEAVANHFKGLTVTLANGTQFPCRVSTFCHDGDWWAMICPEGVSQSGIRNEHDAIQMTEIGRALYERLRTSPAYRYALVGVEVDAFRTFSELDDDVIQRAFDGLVLAEVVWQKLGSPAIFAPFSSGYRWRPFRSAN